MTEDRGDRIPESESVTTSVDVSRSERSGRFKISPRLTYLLIGGAALGLIALMCVAVALIAVFQGS